MAAVTEFFAYKEEILNRCVGDELLLKALHNPGENALTDPTPDYADVLSTNIFPYKRNDNIIETESINFLMFELAATGLDGNFFAEVSVTFYILAHTSNDLILKDGQKVTRVDYIAYRVHELFNSSRGFGIGKLKLDAIRPLKDVPKNYFGSACLYSTVEFNY